MKLYELAANYAQLLELSQDPDIDPAVFEDTLASLEDAIEQKAENIAKIIRTLTSEAEAIKAEEQRLANRRKALENRVEGLKQYLATSLEQAGLEKVKTPTFTVSFRTNRASVTILDETLIPEEYFKVTKTPMKDAIRELLEQGQEIPGVALERGKYLTIR